MFVCIFMFTDYIGELYAEVVLMRVTYPSYKKANDAQKDFMQTVPEPVSKTAGDVDKAAVIAQHRPRFAPGPSTST